MDKFDKDKIFSMMERINSDYTKPEEKPTLINEVGGQTDQNVSADVARLQKTTQQNKSIQQARERINTPQEFKDAFQAWMATTGFVTDNKPFTISQAQTLVRDAMVELGFK